MKYGIKKDVYEILNNLPKARISDKHLIKLYCDYKGLSTDFMTPKGISIGEMKTIERSRRKHQEEFPELYTEEILKIREEERKQFRKAFKNGI